MLRQKSVVKSASPNSLSGKASWPPSEPVTLDHQSRHAQKPQSPHPYPNLLSQSKRKRSKNQSLQSSANLFAPHLPLDCQSLPHQSCSQSCGCRHLCVGIEDDDHGCLYIRCALCRLCWVDELDPTPEEAYFCLPIDIVMERRRVRHSID